MMLTCILFWLLTVIGVLITLSNWYLFFKIYFLRSRASSFIPLLGGGAIAFAFNLPGMNMEAYEIIPLLLDYGCIPLLVQTLLFFIYKGLFGQKAN